MNTVEMPPKRHETGTYGTDQIAERPSEAASESSEMFRSRLGVRSGYLGIERES